MLTLLQDDLHEHTAGKKMSYLIHAFPCRSTVMKAERWIVELRFCTTDIYSYTLTKFNTSTNLLKCFLIKHDFKNKNKPSRYLLQSEFGNLDSQKYKLYIT